jgi:hypothetical protein
MLASILSPGPSLSLYRPHGEVMVVGVNRAASMLPCTAWACGDPELLAATCAKVKGSPWLLTSSIGLTAMRAMRGVHWLGEVMTFDLLRQLFDPIPQWDTFTATAAVVYAAAKGARRIECYGMDWSGTADVDGWDQAGNRSEDRWKLEAGLFGSLGIALGQRGIEVVRYTGGQ